eukprot:jgi/Chlat1/6520/Chrsp45S06071
MRARRRPSGLTLPTPKPVREVPPDPLSVVRDAYGFEVRAEFADEYKRLAPVYAEEEATRAERWSTFLWQYAAVRSISESIVGMPDGEYDIQHMLSNQATAMLSRSQSSKFANARESQHHRYTQHGPTRPPLTAVETAVRFKRNAQIEDASTLSAQAVPWASQLERLVAGGVPMALRAEVWQVFAGVQLRRVPGHYQLLLASFEQRTGLGDSFTKSRWDSQIAKDLPRTFVGHPALEGGRDALRRVLMAYARHNQDTGYCQGMNFLAAALLLLFNEEEAFWMLDALVDEYLSGYFLPDMVDNLVLSSLLYDYLPSLAARFEALGVNVAHVTGGWFLTAFVGALPWETTLRVWDEVLFQKSGRATFFKVILALIQSQADALLTARDFADTIERIQSMAAGAFDSTQLMQIACTDFNGLTTTRIDELRAIHRPQLRMRAEALEMELAHSKNRLHDMESQVAVLRSSLMDKEQLNHELTARLENTLRRAEEARDEAQAQKALNGMLQERLNDCCNKIEELEARIAMYSTSNSSVGSPVTPLSPGGDLSPSSRIARAMSWLHFGRNNNNNNNNKDMESSVGISGSWQPRGGNGADVLATPPCEFSPVMFTRSQRSESEGEPVNHSLRRSLTSWLPTWPLRDTSSTTPERPSSASRPPAPLPLSSRETSPLPRPTSSGGDNNNTILSFGRVSPVKLPASSSQQDFMELRQDIGRAT